MKSSLFVVAVIVLVFFQLVQSADISSDRSEEIFRLVKDNNDKLALQSEDIATMKEKAIEVDARASAMQNQIDNIRFSVAGALFSWAAFVSISCALLTYYFVARTFRDEMRKFAEKVQTEKVVEKIVQVPVKEEYEDKKLVVCPVDGEEVGDDKYGLYCQMHGKKFVAKTVKVRKAAQADIETAARAANALPAKPVKKKSLVKPWTWLN